MIETIGLMLAMLMFFLVFIAPAFSDSPIRVGNIPNISGGSFVKNSRKMLNALRFLD